MNKIYKNHRYAIVCALKDGTLLKPETCSQCGNGGKINAHHEDYDKPLDVVWLCNCCHLRLHHGIPFDAPLIRWSGDSRLDIMAKRMLEGNAKTLSCDGKTVFLPVLEAEPCELSGLFIEDRIADEHEYFAQNIDWETILALLTYREREVIKLRYGINDYREHTLEEVGRIFKVTRERVRQIEIRAICRLRWALKSTKIGCN
jgi:RNA polymerase sigma factor (sigma-70 family)